MMSKADKNFCLRGDYVQAVELNIKNNNDKLIHSMKSTIKIKFSKAIKNGDKCSNFRENGHKSPFRRGDT